MGHFILCCFKANKLLNYKNCVGINTLLFFQVTDLLSNIGAIEYLAGYYVREDAAIYRIFLSEIETIKHIHSVLCAPYEATVHMQRENITISDAFCSWVIAREKVKKLKSIGQERNINIDISHQLIVQMEKRQKDLLNPLAQVAIFLDPRLKHLITNSNNVILSITEIWKRIQNLHERLQTSQDEATNPAHNDDNIPSDSDIMNEYLFSIAPSAMAVKHSVSLWDNKDGEPSINYKKARGEIINELREYQALTTEHYTGPTTNYSMQYWLKKKDHFPEIFEIIKYVSLIPPTQVAVERAFSALSFIFTNRRGQLSRDTLENILTINLNKTRAKHILKTEMNNLG